MQHGLLTDSKATNSIASVNSYDVRGDSLIIVRTVIVHYEREHFLRILALKKCETNVSQVQLQVGIFLRKNIFISVYAVSFTVTHGTIRLFTFFFKRQSGNCTNLLKSILKTL